MSNFEKDNLEKKKVSNPSLVKKRCIENFHKSMKKMVEVCGLSVLGIYHDPNVKKLEVSGDKFSVENISDDVRNKLDSVLAKSFSSGSCQEFVNLRKIKSANKESLNQKEIVEVCHLPKTDFRMFSEKEKFMKYDNNGHLKKAVSSMFKAEGFGRGTNVKGGKYGKPEFKPKWYNDLLEAKCPWEIVRGVEKPKGFSGVWTYFMYDMVVACYSFYLPVEKIEEYVTEKFKDIENVESEPAVVYIPVPENYEFQTPPGNVDNIEIDIENDEVLQDILDENNRNVVENELEANISISNLQDFEIDANDFTNLLDFCTNQQNEFELDQSNSTSIASPSPSAPRACSTIATSPPRSPTNVVFALSPAPFSTGNKRKRKNIDFFKEKMTGRWLKDIIANPYLDVFGTVQVLDKKEQVMPNGTKMTLIKLSDGDCVTWQASGTNEVLEKIEHFNNCVIEIKKATIVKGYKIFIEEIDVVADDIDEEIVHGDSLEYLDKDTYVEILMSRGMVNKDGEKIENHPGFNLTPVRMTRSKASLLKDKEPLLKKLKTGGIKCTNCEKPYKTERTFGNHKCINHA